MPQPRQQSQQQTPQTPTPAPAPAQENAAPQTATTNDGDLTVFGARLLNQAEALAGEKEALFKRIDANRNMLRNLRDTDGLSAEQKDALEKRYPTRERKAKDKADTPADTTTTAA